MTHTKQATVTTPAEREIRIEREFDAPRERVFATMTSPPERIVQTFEWEGMPGHVSVETMTFEDLGDRTRIVGVSVFHTTEERDGMIESGMESGLNETYQRLDEVLAGQEG